MGNDSNVFGMGTFADGGIFATKPYSCGSNYILKMSNYRKDKWCNTLDGLYWKFIHDNRSFFEKNPRLSIIPRSLDKMDKEKNRHYLKMQRILFLQKQNKLVFSLKFISIFSSYP